MPIALAPALSLRRLSGNATLIAVWIAALANADDVGLVVGGRAKIEEITGLPKADVALSLIELEMDHEPTGEKALIHGATSIDGTLRILEAERWIRPAVPSTEVRRESLRESQARWREKNLPDKESARAARLYALYPKKVGRKASILAINRALASGATEAELTEALEAYAKAVATWPPERRQFIPHASTWFNQRRWLDDRTEWEHVSTAAVHPSLRLATLRDAIAEHHANTESKNFDPDRITAEDVANLRALMRKYKEVRNAVAMTGAIPT